MTSKEAREEAKNLRDRSAALNARGKRRQANTLSMIADQYEDFAEMLAVDEGQDVSQMEFSI